MDSFDKVIKWVQAVAAKDFWVDGRRYTAPRSFRINPSFFRDYVCVPLCGGCCSAYSLVWFYELKPNLSALRRHYPGYASTLKECTRLVNDRPDELRQGELA